MIHQPHGQHAPSGASPAQALRQRAHDAPADSPQGRAKAHAPAPRVAPSRSRRRACEGADRHANGEITSRVGQPWVGVEDRQGQPLGMAHPALVRQWVRKGKGKLRRIGATVVKLRCPHAVESVRRHWRREDVVVGVDPGAKTTGIAIIRGGRVLWMAEVTHRSEQITSALEKRRGARSGRRRRRRKRAERVRKPSRWRHRCRRDGWLAPSVHHRVRSAMRWIRWALRFASVGATHVRANVEVCGFDAHKVLCPETEGAGYQHGPLYKANLRSFVLSRDGAKCLYCGSGTAIQLDHVVARSADGVDGPKNRVPACSECNQDKGNQDLEAWLGATGNRKVKRRAKVIREHVAQVSAGARKLASFAAVNVCGPAIATKLQAMGLAVGKTSGADTAAWRRMHGVEKTHCVDAACTATGDAAIRWTCARALNVKMARGRSRLVINRNAAGFPRLKTGSRIVAGHRAYPAHGYRSGDVVRIDKAGVGRGRRIGMLATARNDGRCEAIVHGGKRISVTASRLTLVHRGIGASIR